MYRILLVDDDPHIQTTNEAYLKKQGYQVYRADDGHSALALIQTAELDAIVLDVDMPGLDGVTLCRRLRETSSVPVIFLSAYAKTDDRIRGLMAGGDDYLGKPYSLWNWSCACACVSRAGRTYFPPRFSALTSWRLIWGFARYATTGNAFPFRRWNLSFLPFWHKIPDRYFHMNSSMTTCGNPLSTGGCTTCRSVWRGYARS